MERSCTKAISDWFWGSSDQSLQTDDKPAQITPTFSTSSSSRRFSILVGNSSLQEHSIGKLIPSHSIRKSRSNNLLYEAADDEGLFGTSGSAVVVPLFVDGFQDQIGRCTSSHFSQCTNKTHSNVFSQVAENSVEPSALPNSSLTPSDARVRAETVQNRRGGSVSSAQNQTISSQCSFQLKTQLQQVRPRGRSHSPRNALATEFWCLESPGQSPRNQEAGQRQFSPDSLQMSPLNNFKEALLFTKTEYETLGKLQRKLHSGIIVLRHELHSESTKIVLGSSPEFNTLTVSTYKKKKRFSLGSFEKKNGKTTPHLGEATDVRAGTDPDPHFPGCQGTLVLRTRGSLLFQSMSILWQNYSLHLEFQTKCECLEFLESVRLWRSILH